MSTFVKIESSFYRNRKVLRLRRSIGNDAWWIPPRLWMLCVERRSDDLASYSAEDLAGTLEYEGDAGVLRAALVESGLLTEAGKVVGWEERYGKVMAFYSERARRAANKRWGNGADSRQSSDTEERVDETRLDQTSKHRQASSKDAQSMLGASERGEGQSNDSPSRARSPSLEEWLAEAKAKHASWPQVDAESAWDHYEKVGWYSGNTKIRKWQSCIQTCFRRWVERNRVMGGVTTTPRKPASVPDNSKYADED